MTRFHIITIFPEVFDPYLKTSILGRAKEKGLVDFSLVDLRNFTNDKHRSVDDVPFGGGAGMVMKVESIYKAVKSICRGGALCPPSSEKEKPQNPKIPKSQTRIILLSAKGQKFTQQKARELSKYENIVLICGRYEGVDERVAEYIADEEISIGDYVLTGGELPAMVIADAVTRLVPGVISAESLKEESFGVGADNQLRITNYELRNVGSGYCVRCSFAEEGANPSSNLEKNKNILEYPQYTRPAVFKTDEGEEWRVPDVLLSGNHGEIEKWRSSSREAR